MSEVDFDQIIDAVRKEIALPPVEGFVGRVAGCLRAPKAADRDRPARRRASPMIRIRRVGEGQKRYR